ncbi:hypothetical protein BDV12DRAFT_41883 [Aspergillus spectabilis]
MIKPPSICQERGETLSAVRFTLDKHTSVTVRLAAIGNRALYELCHTDEQRTVWALSSYELTI